MCNITMRYYPEDATVYKVIAKEIKTGILRSTFTSQIFKTGKVRKPTTRSSKILNNYWVNYNNNGYNLRTHPCNKHDYPGLTSGFVHKNDAESLLRTMRSHTTNLGYELILVKVKLTGTLYKGMYSQGRKCIAGSHITEIIEL